MKLKRAIPTFPVIDIEKAVLFYQDKMGFKNLYHDKTFAKLTRDDIELHLWASCDKSWKARSFFLFLRPIWSGAESFLAGTASCRFEVENIEVLYQEYKEQGVIYNPDTVVEKMNWGTKEFAALDLHRNLITFFEYNVSK